MSALAQQHGAVNLGQGFPDFDCDPALLDAASRRCTRASTSTRRWPACRALREAIAAKIERAVRHRYDPGSEITITAGATQAILTAILAIVHPGDEVIVLSPATTATSPTSSWPAARRCACR